MTALDWIKSCNTTNAKALSIVGLWIATFFGTFAIAFVCMFWKLACPVELIGLWYAGLTAYSGVGYLTQKNYRETDWKLNEIKAGATQPATVVQAGAQVQVAAATTAEQPTK